MGGSLAPGDYQSFFALLAHVPAPQLASPLGAAAFFFFATGLAAEVLDGALLDGAGAALDALEPPADVAELAGAAAGAGSAAGVLGPAAAVAGLDALAAGAAAALFAPHEAAEQDAWPAAGVADPAGATSLACTGGGVLPPQAARAPAPTVARTAAKCSNDKFGRVGRITILLRG